MLALKPSTTLYMFETSYVMLPAPEPEDDFL